MEQSDGDYLRAIIALVSSKRTLPVIHTLQGGIRRYGEINRMLPDVTQKVLTETLRRLERGGLIKRTVHPDALVARLSACAHGKILLPAVTLRESALQFQANCSEPGLIS